LFQGGVRVTKLLMVSLAGNLDIAGELGAILGAGFEVVALRGADRQKLEMALDGRTQYDIVHFCGHGAPFVLSAGDGLLPEAELVTLMEQQKVLQFVVIASCDGLEVAGALHNALHVPVVAFTGEMRDRAAVEFARAFYRAWRGLRDVGQAVVRGREALEVLYPGEALKVRLINGDMVTPLAFLAAMRDVDARLMGMDAKAEQHDVYVAGQLGQINLRLNQIEGVPRRWFGAGVVLVVILIFAQLGTPFLQEWLRLMR